MSLLNRLRHLSEQDEAAAVEWWQEATEEDKLRVWAAIQALEGTPMVEIVGRFAQVGFCHVALLANRSKGD